jgi:nicotinamidase/pyrazinamidase
VGVELDRRLGGDQAVAEIVEETDVPTIFAAMEALIIVDVQNDFCPGGALAVDEGDEIIPVINELARDTPFVVATRDWHPAAHSSFVERGGQWPVHCVQGTEGAELHSTLDARAIDLVVDKGQEVDEPGYSGFEHTELERRLREQGVERVDIVGLALDYCVKATALAAKKAGFGVTVHRAATRAVNVQPGDDERAVAELRAAGVTVVG